MPIVLLLSGQLDESVYYRYDTMEPHDFNLLQIARLPLPNNLHTPVTPVGNLLGMLVIIK